MGNPKAFERLLGPEAKLSTLEEAMGHTKGQRKRGFPWFDTIRWVMKNKGVIVPGAAVVVETLGVAVSAHLHPCYCLCVVAKKEMDAWFLCI